MVTLHIRSVGGWTSRLHEYFQEENELIELETKGLRKAPEQPWRKKLEALIMAL